LIVYYINTHGQRGAVQQTGRDEMNAAQVSYEIKAAKSPTGSEFYRIVMWTLSKDRSNNVQPHTAFTYKTRAGAEKKLRALAEERGAEIEMMGGKPHQFYA
jgi:hypothetical protein